MSSLHPKRSVQDLLRAWAQVVAHRPDAQPWGGGRRGRWIPERSPRHGCEVQGAGDRHAVSMTAEDGRRTAKKRPSPLRGARRRPSFRGGAPQRRRLTDLNGHRGDKLVGRPRGPDRSVGHCGGASVGAVGRGRAARVAEAGPAAVQDVFSLEQIGENLWEVYDRALSTASPHEG